MSDPTPPPQSNTWLIVFIVVAVLAVPALCVCGGTAAWFFLGVSPQPIQQPKQPRPEPEERRMPQPPMEKPG
jgi:hypothetical protein